MKKKKESKVIGLRSRTEEKHGNLLIIGASIFIILINIFKIYIFTDQLIYLQTKFTIGQLIGGYLESTLIIVFAILIMIFKNKKIALVVLIITSLEFLLTVITSNKIISPNLAQLLFAIVIIERIIKIRKSKNLKGK